MNTREEQAQLRHARAVVARSNELFDRLGEVWISLLDHEQVEIVERAEQLAKENEAN